MLKFLCFLLSAVSTDAAYSDSGLRDRKLVYVAGSLFNSWEQLAQEGIADLLEDAGFRTFLPQRDGLEMVKIEEVLEKQFHTPKKKAGELMSEVIYSLDVYQVAERCGAYVGNFNGVVMDDGTIAELTYAAMVGNPVIYFRDDYRSHFNGSMNPLVTVAADAIVTDKKMIVPALKSCLKKNRIFEPALPPIIAERVKKGKALWQELEKLNTERTERRRTAIARAILRIFSPQA